MESHGICPCQWAYIANIYVVEAILNIMSVDGGSLKYKLQSFSDPRYLERKYPNCPQINPYTAQNQVE